MIENINSFNNSNFVLNFGEADIMSRYYIHLIKYVTQMWCLSLSQLRKNVPEDICSDDPGIYQGKNS